MPNEYGANTEYGDKPGALLNPAATAVEPLSSLHTAEVPPPEAANETRPEWFIENESMRLNDSVNGSDAGPPGLSDARAGKPQTWPDRATNRYSLAEEAETPINSNKAASV